MVSGALRQLILLVPFIWIFTKYFGLNAAWYAFWIAEVTDSLYSLLTVRQKMRKKNILL